MSDSRLILSDEASYAKDQNWSGNSPIVVNQFFIIYSEQFVVINIWMHQGYYIWPKPQKQNEINAK